MTSSSCVGTAEQEAPEGQDEWAEFRPPRELYYYKGSWPPSGPSPTHAGPQRDATVEESGGCGEPDIVIWFGSVVSRTSPTGLLAPPGTRQDRFHSPLGADFGKSKCGSWFRTGLSQTGAKPSFHICPLGLPRNQKRQLD